MTDLIASRWGKQPRAHRKNQAQNRPRPRHPEAHALGKAPRAAGDPDLGCQHMLTSPISVDIDLAKLNLGNNPERLVLSATTGSSGTAEVVYRSGGTVSIDQLERLCERVGWPPRPVDKVKGALENSFLVRCRLRSPLCRCAPFRVAGSPCPIPERRSVIVSVVGGKSTNISIRWVPRPESRPNK